MYLVSGGFQFLRWYSQLLCGLSVLLLPIFYQIGICVLPFIKIVVYRVLNLSRYQQVNFFVYELPIRCNILPLFHLLFEKNFDDHTIFCFTKSPTTILYENSQEYIIANILCIIYKNKVCLSDWNIWSSFLWSCTFPFVTIDILFSLRYTNYMYL